MKTLAVIKEQDIFADAPVVNTSEFSHREAARAVVANKAGQIALLHVTNRNYHKLPGGGIEPGENIEKALDREVLEEIGCEIEIVQEIGQIIEHRDQWEMQQTSYCYLARQVGEQQSSAFTDEELEHGFEVVWAKDIDDAIATLEADNPAGYDGERIKPRDLTFLKAAKVLLA